MPRATTRYEDVDAHSYLHTAIRHSLEEVRTLKERVQRSNATIERRNKTVEELRKELHDALAASKKPVKSWMTLQKGNLGPQ